jgi:hypothetical protein
MEQMSWMVITLLPKSGGYIWGIGLLDPDGIVVEKVTACQLAAIEFYPCLHRGLPKRGTKMATIEAKLAQQLAWMEQEPFYQIYVYLRRAYDHLGQEQVIKIMIGYGVAPKPSLSADKVMESGKDGLSCWG